LVAAGDLYVMCSDGLSDMVGDAEIATILESQATIEQKAERLVAAANEHGGRDNITVLMVQAAAGSEKRGLISRLLRK
jgi:PPM family protein phosphatase